MGAIVASMFVLSSAIVVSSKLTDTVRSAQRYFSGSGTKSSMAVIRDFIIQQSRDVDNDGHYELPKEGPGNTVPLSIPISPIDTYGTAYQYCTWDAGSHNVVDPTYSQNNVAPPVAGLIGRLVSGGSDKTITTDCLTATAPAGDDIVLEIYENSVSYASAALGGWKDNGSYLSQLNPIDKVVIGSQNTPTHQLEIKAGTAAEANTPAGGLAIGNVEIFNSAGNSAQVNITGGVLNVNGGGLQMSGVALVDSSRNITAATLASSGNATVGGTLTVTGVTTLTGSLTANGGLGTTTLNASALATLNSLTVTNNATVGGTTTLTGALTANGGINTTTLTTSGAATLNSLGVTNNATVGGTLTVTGQVNLSSGVFQMGGTTIFSTTRNMIGVNGLGQNLLPTATNTWSLGSGGAQYLNIYGQNIYQNGNKVIDASALSGTANYMTKFTGANSVGNSLIYDNGTHVFVGTTVDNGSGGVFQVSGFATASSGFAALDKIGGTAAAGVRLNSITFGKDSTAGMGWLQAYSAAAGQAIQINPLGGNVLVGTTVNDGINKFQVAGSGWFSTNLTVGTGSGPASIVINADQGSVSDFGYQINGVSRWLIRRNTETETGADAGSNLDFISRTDAGTYKSTMMRLFRGSGNVTIGGSADDGNRLQVAGSMNMDGGATGALILSSGTSTNIDSPLLGFWGATGAGRTSVGPTIQGVSSPVNSAWGRHDLVFRQHDADDYSTSFEAGRITYKGSWLMGAGVVNDNTSRLQVAGDINLQSGSIKYPDGTTQNSGSGAAKAWVRWSWPNTVQAGYNVSGITDNGNGTATIHFTTPMTDSNYAVSLSTNNSAADAQQRGLVVSGSPTTTAVTVAAPVSQTICSAVIYR